jgi:hypothetical protein
MVVDEAPKVKDFGAKELIDCRDRVDKPYLLIGKKH